MKKLRAQDSERDKSKFNSQFCISLVIQTTFLSHSFIICQAGIILPTSKDCCDGYIRKYMYNIELKPGKEHSIPYYLSKTLHMSTIMTQIIPQGCRANQKE